MQTIDRTNSKIIKNKLYPTVLQEYNDIIAREGKVNNNRFYEEFVKPRIGVAKSVWYKHIKKIEMEGGKLSEQMPIVVVPPSEMKVVQQRTISTIADNATATRNMIQNILNIGQDGAQKLIENPDALSPKEKIELGFKAMRAQDSRIFAVAAVKKDQREEKAFQQSFDDAAYQESIFEDEPASP